MRFMFSLAAAAGAAILFLGCGGAEEVTQQPQGQVVSPTATPTSVVTATPTVVATPVPTAAVTAAPTKTPIPVNENGVVVPPPSRDSLPPTPTDWLTMSDPALSHS